MLIPFTVESVCERAFVLNCVCKRRKLKIVHYRDFYELKNRLIKWLYLHGYAREVIVQYKDARCWTCGGKGCSHCFNGVHHKIKYYAVAFKVGNKFFNWHQPAKQVDYKIISTGIQIGPHDAPKHIMINPLLPLIEWLYFLEIKYFLEIVM